jgi:hypothetical protein
MTDYSTKESISNKKILFQQCVFSSFTIRCFVHLTLIIRHGAGKGGVYYYTESEQNPLVNVSFVDSDRSMLDGEHTLLRLLLLLLLWMMMPAAKDPAARAGHRVKHFFSMPGGKSSGAPLILRHGQLGTLYGAAATRTKKNSHNSQNCCTANCTPNIQQTKQHHVLFAVAVLFSPFLLDPESRNTGLDDILLHQSDSTFDITLIRHQRGIGDRSRTTWPRSVPSVVRGGCGRR